MSTDTVADMIVQLKNANMRYIEKIDVPASKIKQEIVRILKEEGYIVSYKRIEHYKQDILRIFLKYGPNKERVITGMRRVSKPGLRIYNHWNELPRVRRGLGISIVSTPKGLITEKEARKQHLGGEVICTVW